MGRSYSWNVCNLVNYVAATNYTYIINFTMCGTYYNYKEAMKKLWNLSVLHLDFFDLVRIE